VIHFCNNKWKGNYFLNNHFRARPQGERFTISDAARREVLARLLKLNHERYEEEVKAGLHVRDKGKKGKGKSRAKPSTRRKETSPAQVRMPISGSSRVNNVERTQTEKKNPAIQPEPQKNFLDLLEAEPITILTRLPFIGLKGSIYCSPMPFGKYDPDGKVLREMKQNKVDMVVDLASDQEGLEQSGRDLQKLYQNEGLRVIQLPIPDLGIPEKSALD
jgi:hypothetical protein